VIEWKVKVKRECDAPLQEDLHGGRSGFRDIFMKWLGKGTKFQYSFKGSIKDPMNRSSRCGFKVRRSVSIPSDMEKL